MFLMPAINEIEMVKWLTMPVTSPFKDLLGFWSTMHASVDVFWSRGYEQEGLCSRLLFFFFNFF